MMSIIYRGKAYAWAGGYLPLPPITEKWPKAATGLSKTCGIRELGTVFRPLL